MMTREQFIFFLELLTSNLEKSFLEDLNKDPRDEATRKAYADWLTENNREESSKLILSGFTPGSHAPWMGRVVSGTVSIHQVSSGMVTSGSIGIRPAGSGS